MPDQPPWTLSPVANVHYGKRDPVYHKQLLDSKESGECIFCAPGFPHDQKLYWEEDGWMLFECRPPRKDVENGDTDGHLVLAPRRHGEELADADWIAFGKACRFIEQVLGWTGYGIGWRVGDPARSGRTIIHVHAHFIRPRQKIQDETGELGGVPVFFPIG